MPMCATVRCSPAGFPVRPTNRCHRVFSPAVRSAGLDDVHFQDLLYTHASLRLSQGVAVNEVQAQLGNARASITFGRLQTPARETRRTDRQAAGTEATPAGLNLVAPHTTWRSDASCSLWNSRRSGPSKGRGSLAFLDLTQKTS